MWNNIIYENEMIFLQNVVLKQKMFMKIKWFFFILHSVVLKQNMFMKIGMHNAVYLKKSFRIMQK